MDGLVNLAARIVWMFSYPVRMLQSGRVSSYALLIVLGVLMFLGYYLHVAGVTLHNVLHLLEGEDGNGILQYSYPERDLVHAAGGSDAAAVCAAGKREPRIACSAICSRFIGLLVSLPLMWRFQVGARRAISSARPPTGFPRSARTTRWASTASASCW